MNREVIATSFERSAQTYDQEGECYQKASEQLLEVLKGHEVHSECCLEIGSHTGILSDVLSPWLGKQARKVSIDIQSSGYRENKDKADYAFIQAEGEELPFQGESFDLICSNATFQWYRDWSRGIAEAIRCLKPGGYLAFTQFIQPSLEPLKSVYEKYGEGDRFLPLMSFEELQQKCFNALVVQKMEEEWNYSDLKELRTSIKNLGIGASSSRKRPISRDCVQALKNWQEEKSSISLSITLALVLLRKGI